MTTIIVYSIWKAEDRIEVPDEDAPAILDTLNRGRLDVPDEIAEQISATGAELMDWSAEEVRKR